MTILLILIQDYLHYDSHLIIGCELLFRNICSESLNSEFLRGSKNNKLFIADKIHSKIGIAGRCLGPKLRPADRQPRDDQTTGEHLQFRQKP